MPKVIVKGKELETSILFRLRENGEIVYKELPFNNYFYIKQNDYDIISFSIKKYIKDHVEVVDKFGEQYVKLILADNTRRYFLKKIIEGEGIKTYESDVNAVKRFLTINELPWSDVNQLKIGYFDLETDDRGEFVRDERGNVVASTQILSCAIGPQKFERGNVVYFCTENPDDKTRESETKLLMKIFDELKKYDVISAWNSDTFDIPYLKQRQVILGLEEYFDWTFVNTMDDMVLFKTFYAHGYKSYSLDNVSKQLLGEEKIKFMDYFVEPPRDSRGKFYKLFKENPELFKKYNIKDVELMQMIEEKTKNYAPKLALSRITQAPLQDTAFNSFLVDHLYLRKAHKYNVICESNPDKFEQETRKLALRPGGGYTFCYEPGVYFNLETFDFKSFYPLTLMSFNISPETFVKVMSVDLDELNSILTPEELYLMKQSIALKAAHQKKKGEIKESYNREIKLLEDKYKLKLFDIMFKFTSNYTAKNVREYCLKNNYVFTPADFNHDTNGWTLHPHRLYRRELGIYPEMNKEVLSERDKIKYEMKRKSNEDVKFVNSEEYWSMNYHQTGLKILGNSSYGVLGAVHTRFYNYDLVDSITTSARWIMKRTILFAQSQGHKVVQGDTDSMFIVLGEHIKDNSVEVKKLNKEFFDLYKSLLPYFNTNFDIEIKNPETGEKERAKYWMVFEWEHSFAAFIGVMKKKYYYIEQYKDKEGNLKFEVKSQGGAFIKTDTSPLAAKLQKNLCEDIMLKKYDREAWKNKINEWKDICFGQKLEPEYLKFSKKYTKHHTEFGKVMMDSETGAEKKTAAGLTRYAPIPMHIKLVKELEEKGEVFNVGDTIDYIVKQPATIVIEKTLKNGTVKRIEKTDGKQVAISIKQYLEGEKYDAQTYWRRIVTPLIEVLLVADKSEVFKTYKDCWGMTDREIMKELKELEMEEVEGEE